MSNYRISQLPSLMSCPSWTPSAQPDSDGAAKRGQAIHALAAIVAAGKQPNLDKLADEYLCSVGDLKRQEVRIGKVIDKLMDSWQVCQFGTEVEVTLDAGRLDLIVPGHVDLIAHCVDGKKRVVDWKSGASLFNPAWQVIAYALAAGAAEAYIVWLGDVDEAGDATIERVDIPADAYKQIAERLTPPLSRCAGPQCSYCGSTGSCQEYQQRMVLARVGIVESMSGAITNERAAEIYSMLPQLERSIAMFKEGFRSAVEAAGRVVCASTGTVYSIRKETRRELNQKAMQVLAEKFGPEKLADLARFSIGDVVAAAREVAPKRGKQHAEDMLLKDLQDAGAIDRLAVIKLASTIIRK